MNKKYVISLFFICSILVVLLIFILWTRHEPQIVVPEYDLAEDELSNEFYEDSSADDVIQMKNGYYLFVNRGLVCVYRATDDSVYYLSDIPIDSLPVDLQKEILQKKYMESELDIYYFLESYSS